MEKKAAYMRILAAAVLVGGTIVGMLGFRNSVSGSDTHRNPSMPTLPGAATSTSDYGNGGYTGADGNCHVGPPAPWQNGCINGTPIGQP